MKKNVKKAPVIIFCKGGNNHTNNKIRTPEKKVEFYYYFLNQYVKNGYIVFISNYRGSKFSEGKDEFGGKDVNDVKNLYNIIKKWKLSNENKINVIGQSRGCIMATLLHKEVNWIKSSKDKTWIFFSSLFRLFSFCDNKDGLV